jgi:outer membrane lipoprotein-sorting protein
MLHISTVFVSKPEHISYAEAMSRMRMWLDFRKIETSSFKLAPEGREGLEITFGTNSHAVLFQSEFTWPPASPIKFPPRL